MNFYPDSSPKLLNKVKDTIKTSLIFCVLCIYTGFFSAALFSLVRAINLPQELISF